MNSTRVLALREVVRMAMANNFPPPHLQDPNDEPRRRAGSILQEWIFRYLPIFMDRPREAEEYRRGHYRTETFLVHISINIIGTSGSPDMMLNTLLVFCFTWTTYIDKWCSMDREDLERHLREMMPVIETAEGNDDDRQYLLHLINTTLGPTMAPEWTPV